MDQQVGEETLKHFLTTGVLKGLRLNMTLKAVLNYIGVGAGDLTAEQLIAQLPELLARREDRPHHTLSYGPVELILDLEIKRIISIKVLLVDGISRDLPGALDDGWLQIVDGMTRAAFWTFAQRHHIPIFKEYPIDDDLEAESLSLRVAVSAVNIGFDLKDDADVLYFMQKSIYSEIEPGAISWRFTS